MEIPQEFNEHDQRVHDLFGDHGIKIKYNLYNWHKATCGLFLGDSLEGMSYVIDTAYNEKGDLCQGEGMIKFLCELLEAKLRGDVHVNTLGNNTFQWARHLAMTAPAGIGKSDLLSSFISFALMHYPFIRFLYFGGTKGTATSVIKTKLLYTMLDNKKSETKNLDEIIRKYETTGKFTPSDFFYFFSGLNTYYDQASDVKGLKIHGHRGLFTIYSADANVQGESADMVIFDDFVVYGDASSLTVMQGKIEALGNGMNRLRSDMLIRKMTNGRFKNLGALSINNSVAHNDTSRLIASRYGSISHYIKLDMIAEENEEYEVYKYDPITKQPVLCHTWNRYVGQCLNELHKDKDDVMVEVGDWESPNNPSREECLLEFLTKYQNKLNVGTTYCFKTENIRRYHSLEQVPVKSSSHIKVFVDTASSTSKDANHSVALLVAYDLHNNNGVRSFDVYVLDMIYFKTEPERFIVELSAFLHNNKTPIPNKNYTISEVVIENASSGMQVAKGLRNAMKANRCPNIPVVMIQRNKKNDEETQKENFKIKASGLFGKKTSYRCYDIAHYVNQGHLLLPSENTPKKDIAETIVNELKYIRGSDSNEKEINNKNDDIASALADAFIEGSLLSFAPEIRPFSLFTQEQIAELDLYGSLIS